MYAEGRGSGKHRKYYYGSRAGNAKESLNPLGGNMIREMGGYFELEHFSGVEYHDGALALDCARNGLAYLIEARGISSLWVPGFLCASVDNVCARYDVDVRHYEIAADFAPDYESMRIGPSDYLYLVDYYGQLSDEDIAAAREASGGRLIVDEVMAFFRWPLAGVDTIYSCRKFFGVSDGAYLYTDACIGRELAADESHGRMGFVLGRYERPANDFFREASANNGAFAEHDIRLMSPLTHNILRAVDYPSVARRRRRNFELAASMLDEVNELSPVATDGAFMYPLLVRGGEQARRQLQARKIYISTLWPHATDREGLTRRYARDILPVIIDQRYDADDIAYECSVVREVLEGLAAS